jgi:hypothetical protein
MMMKKLIRERYAGLAATSAALAVGLIIVSSLIIEIGVTGLAGGYGGGPLPRAQSQSDAPPAATRLHPSDQRGLVLYFLMEAARGQFPH